MKIPIILIFAGLASGCAMLTPPKEQPIIEDKLGDTRTLAITPERRVVLVSASKFCAEPSPDVAESLTSSVKALAEAAVKKGDAQSVTASLQLAKEFSTSINTLFVRSQGVQFFRDGAYTYCQAYHNGAINQQKFDALMTDLMEKSNALISQEIPSIEHAKELNLLQKAEQAAANADASAIRAKASAQDAKASANQAAASADKAKKDEKVDAAEPITNQDKE